ncbi:DUF2219 family protein [Serratia marcescens]|uniref:DUF2219 family protein n=1 Tax=Serratia marcescens TaxID=615 RepID=A0A939SR78_SERMA|nr:DUF2219 family protein [Serratia marcescens]
MFTPTERKRRGLIASDRPYAGALMFSGIQRAHG